MVRVSEVLGYEYISNEWEKSVYLMYLTGWLGVCKPLLGKDRRACESGLSSYENWKKLP